MRGESLLDTSVADNPVAASSPAPAASSTQLPHGLGDPTARWERWAAARNVDWEKFLARGQQQLEAWTAAAMESKRSSEASVTAVRRKLHAMTKGAVFLHSAQLRANDEGTFDWC